MEGLNLLQNMLQKQKGDYSCKLDLKDTYICVPLKKGIKEICKVSVGRDTLRVPLSLFWYRLICSNIYQNFKRANFPPEKASDFCDTWTTCYLCHRH